MAAVIMIFDLHHYTDGGNFAVSSRRRLPEIQRNKNKKKFIITTFIYLLINKISFFSILTISYFI